MLLKRYLFELRGIMTGKRVWVRVLAVLLAVLQAYPLAAQIAPPPPLSTAGQEVREEVRKIPIDGKLTVKMASGTEYHGRLLAIAEEEFSIHEVDLKRNMTLRYSDVNRARKNYGGKGIGGQRVSPRKSVMIGVVAIGALLIFLIVALAKDKS